MPDGISIKVTAETADLSAKLALAQADMRAFGAQTRTAAEAMRAAGASASSELRAGLERAAMAAAQAKAQVAQLRAEMNETAARGKSGMADLRAGIDELARPLTRATAAVGALGEIFVAGLGLGRLAESVNQMAEMGAQLERMSAETGIAVENIAGLRYAAEQFGVQADTLDRALAILAKNMSEAIAQPAGRMALAFGNAGMSMQELQAHSNDLLYVLLQLSKAFHAHEGGARALAEALVLLGTRNAALVDTLRQGPDAIAAMIAKDGQLEGMTKNVTTALDQHRKAILDVGTAWGGFEAKLAASMPWLDTAAEKLARLLSIQTTSAAARGAHMPALPGAGAAPEGGAAASGGASAEVAIPPVSAKQSGAALPQFGDIPQVTSALSQFQAKLAQVKADMEETGASNAAILEREVALWRQEVGAADLTAQQKIQAERSYQQARIQLMQATGSDAIALARGQAEAIAADDSKTKAEQLAAEAGVWQALLAGTRMSYEQRIEATRSLNQTLAELGRQRVADAKHNADAETKALSASYRQITEEAKKNAEALKKYLDDVARWNKQNAEQTARDWNQGFNAIEGAAKTVLDDVITRHETLAQAGQQAVQKLVLSWIEGLAEIMVKIAAFEALSLASGIGGPLGSRFKSGANALGGSAAVAPTYGGGAGTPATGLAAVLPAGLAAMLGIGGAGGAQNQGMQQLQQAITGNTTATMSNSKWGAGRACR